MSPVRFSLFLFSLIVFSGRYPKILDKSNITCFRDPVPSVNSFVNWSGETQPVDFTSRRQSDVAFAEKVDSGRFVLHLRRHVGRGFGEGVI